MYEYNIWRAGLKVLIRDNYYNKLNVEHTLSSF